MSSDLTSDFVPKVRLQIIRVGSELVTQRILPWYDGEISGLRAIEWMKRNRGVDSYTTLIETPDGLYSECVCLWME